MDIANLDRHVVSGLQQAIRELGADAGEQAALETPPEISQGDYAFPCFLLARTLRKNPALLAKDVASRFPLDDLVERVEAVGPYVNVKIHRKRLAEIVVGQVLDEGEAFGRSKRHGRQKVVIEYSAPNTNKPMHLGHVRNNTIGSALALLMEAVGYEVHPVNLVNDRGIHICKSMVAFRKWGEGRTPETTGKKGDHFVGDYYVRFERELAKEREAFGHATREKAEGESDERREMREEADFLAGSRLMQEARECLRNWEAGDPETVALWKKLNGWVMDGFEQTYEAYGCRFDKIYMESETYKLGKKIVLEGVGRGVFARDEDGSVWVDLSAVGLDRKLLLRRDGTSVYITQDLGTAKLRHDEFDFDRSIYVVGSEQEYHFKVLFEILRMLGYPWAEGCEHLSYGMVYLPEGKMKSREGKVVDADDLLELLQNLAKERVRDRFPHMPRRELNRTAIAVALAAVKWYLLRVHPEKDINFDPQSSIEFEGATGPAIQYAHTRILSILRKGGYEVTASRDPADLDEEVLSNLVDDEEHLLLREVRRFPGHLERSSDTCNPSVVANELFELAKAFHRYYTERPVLKADTPAMVRARLLLVRAVAVVLENGMALLGIPMPERM